MASAPTTATPSVPDWMPPKASGLATVNLKALLAESEFRGSLEAELQETLNGLDGLRQENANLTETLGRAENDRAALQSRAKELSEELEAVVTSPGWKLISSYRDWLQDKVWTKPWLGKPYEAVAQRILGGGDSRRSY